MDKKTRCTPQVPCACFGLRVEPFGKGNKLETNHLAAKQYVEAPRFIVLSVGPRLIGMAKYGMLS